MLTSCFTGNNIQESYLKVSNFHRKFILPLWFIVALVLVGITAYLSFIGGRKEHYNDVTEHWESCLFQPNYVVLPIKEVASTSPLAPVLKSLGITLEDKSVASGSFVNALVYVCCQTITLTLLGQLVLLRSWNHIGWILPSAFFGLWCSLLSLTYYTASPPLPVASQTTSTLILLSYWLRKAAFDNLNNGNNLCGSTYSFILIVIILNVILFLLSLHFTSFPSFLSFSLYFLSLLSSFSLFDFKYLILNSNPNRCLVYFNCSSWYL